MQAPDGTFQLSKAWLLRVFALRPQYCGLGLVLLQRMCRKWVFQRTSVFDAKAGAKPKPLVSDMHVSDSNNFWCLTC